MLHDRLAAALRLRDRRFLVTPAGVGLMEVGLAKLPRPAE
jgi:hypothetical protein